MDLQISIEELRQRKIFVATTMYGGQCAGEYTRSCIDLARTFSHYGMEGKFYFLFNESLITRARNYLADDFMRSGFTHLMFIDSDIGFDANDVIAMAAMASDDSPYDVLCGPYPKKAISWEKIKRAVDRGAADANPNQLERYVGDYVFNFKADTSEIRIAEPAEIMEGGTGFMMIKRKVLEVMADSHPELLYRPDHARSEDFDGSREISLFFNCEIDPQSRRYLSEDYLFCRMVQKLGMKVWLCPWMKLRHVGSYIFGGSLADLAAIEANPTVDPSEINKRNVPRAPRAKP